MQFFPVKDQTFHFTNVKRIDPPVTHTIKHGMTAGRQIWTGINLDGYICLERHVDVMLVVSIARNLTPKLLKSCRLEFSRFLTLVSIRARRVRVGFISFKDGKFYDNLYSVQNARCVLMQNGLKLSGDSVEVKQGISWRRQFHRHTHLADIKFCCHACVKHHAKYLLFYFH